MSDVVPYDRDKCRSEVIHIGTFCGCLTKHSYVPSKNYSLWKLLTNLNLFFVLIVVALHFGCQIIRLKSENIWISFFYLESHKNTVFYFAFDQKIYIYLHVYTIYLHDFVPKLGPFTLFRIVLVTSLAEAWIWKDF